MSAIAVRPRRFFASVLAASLLSVSSLASAQATGSVSASAKTSPPPPLFQPAGISALDVRQGDIASCFFYATIAAAANAKPTAIHDLIQDAGGGNYKVTFLDGKVENISTDDAMYARRNGFDKSSAFWVAVAFRAYAQRTLRNVLLTSIDSTQLPSFWKETAKMYVGGSDTVLLAYDRAIREQVYQNGVFDKGRLEVDLTGQMQTLGIAKPMQKQVIDYLNDKDFLKTFAKMLDDNGEIFGAYRAVGQGGIPKAVFAAFSGDSDGQFITDEKAGDAKTTLKRIHAGGVGAVASSRDELPHDMLLRVRTDPAHPDWWVADHAYTLIDYNEGLDEVKLRNPWGEHPGPDGTFVISFADFLTAFQHMAVTK
jgi:hypothetical protein